MLEVFPKTIAEKTQEKFTTQSVPGATFIKRIGDLLFYKDSNED